MIPLTDWFSRIQPPSGYRAELAVVCVVVILSALVNPQGEFPVNDDWAYTHSVQWLLDEHRVRLSDWIAMNLLPQTLAGGAVAKLFGFSFSVLRHLTQLVSVFVAVLTLHWFIAVGLARRDALVATLTVIAIPYWLPVANSFMTDLYAMLFAIPAATLFFRALQTPRSSLIVFATLLAVIGVLQRQVVAVLPAAFLIAWLVSNRRFDLRTLAIGFLPMITVIAAEFLYLTYLIQGPGVPEAQQYAHGRVLPLLATFFDPDAGWYRLGVSVNLLTILAYLGLFVLPFALWRGFPKDRVAAWLLLLLASLILIAMAVMGIWPPWREYQLMDGAGIGPFVLYDAQPRELAQLDRSPGVVWRIAAAGAAVGIALLLYMFYSTLRRIVTDVRHGAGQRLFLLTLVGAYIAPFIFTDYIDRYLLFILPFVLALMAQNDMTSPASFSRSLSMIWLLAALVMGTMATHDYFAWNRARWSAIHTAESLGATPATLDGGFEYNGYHRFEVQPRVIHAGKSWWWVEDDRFVVSFTVVPGYIERARYPVEAWLSRTPAVVRLLEREAQD
jgi:hypothetical protein